MLHNFAARFIPLVEVGASSSTIGLMSSARGAWGSSTLLHEKVKHYLISHSRVQGRLALAVKLALFSLLSFFVGILSGLDTNDLHFHTL